MTNERVVNSIFHTDNNNRRTKMATSLLRLGRLGSVKGLLRDSWSTPRTPFVAALCTKGDIPPKTPKKAKASSKTIEADERASLLAYKSTVAFPSKLSATGFLLKDVALGETEIAEVVSTAAANETTTDSPVVETAAADVAVEEAKITEVPPTDGATTESEGSKTSVVKAEIQQDQDSSSSSSSSSSSDSDSDSDSDDEKPKAETQTQSGEKAAEEKKAPSLTIEEIGVTDKEAKPESASLGDAQESAENVTKATPKEVAAPSASPVGSEETLVDPAPVLSSMTEEIPEVKEAKPEIASFGEAQENVTKATPEEVPAPSAISVETLIDPTPVLSSTTEEIPEVKEAKPESASFGEAQESAENVTKATPEEGLAPSATSVETLNDPAPVLSSMTEEIPEVSSESIIVAIPDKIVDTGTEIKTAPTEEIAFEKEPEFKVEDGPVIKVEDAVKVFAEVVPEVTTEARPEVAETAVEAPGDVAAPKTEAGTLAAPSEELEDPAPVTPDAVEALAETDVVETPEEQAPEKAPEPEPEPFDNTTYKNLQHHQYDMYTFADMDVEMSKHRLPQPSAARH